MAGRGPHRIARKHFLSTALLASAAAVSCARQTPTQEKDVPATVLTLKDYDYPAMMARLRTRSPHKQVFLAIGESHPLPGLFRGVQLNAKELYNKMQLAMNAYEFSLGRRRAKLATLGVLTEDSVILGLNDAMWTKYQLGRRYHLASTNIYYHAKSNLDLRSSPDDPNGIYQDWSAQAVLKRGGAFMVCHNALAGLANAVAVENGLAPTTALAEMSGNLMPGFLLVPAGVAAVQLAQEYGWKLFAPA